MQERAGLRTNGHSSPQMMTRKDILCDNFGLGLGYKGLVFVF